MKEKLKKLIIQYYKDQGLVDMENLKQTVDTIKGQLDEQILATKALKIDWGSLKDTSVLIGTPCFGGMLYDVYQKAVTNVLLKAQEKGIKMDVMLLGNESLIQRGRNTIANEFMASDYEYLMFIDADIGFQPESFFQLLQQKQRLSGGAYSTKSLEWGNIKQRASVLDAEALQFAGARFAYNPINTEKQVIHRYKLAPVKQLATGFLLIHRSVFEQFQVSRPNHRYINNHILQPKFFTEKPEELWCYFDTGIDFEKTRTYLSEDYWFCDKALDMGFDLYLAPWINLVHRGTYSFTGDFITAMSTK